MTPDVAITATEYGPVEPMTTNEGLNMSTDLSINMITSVGLYMTKNVVLATLLSSSETPWLSTT